MCSHLNARQQGRIRSLALKREWDDERVLTRTAEQLGLRRQLASLYGQATPDTPLISLSRFLPLRGLRKTA
jgi:hypothetical protein